MKATKDNLIVQLTQQNQKYFNTIQYLISIIHDVCAGEITIAELNELKDKVENQPTTQN